MQGLIAHKHSVIVDHTYLQKLFNITKKRVDYNKLVNCFNPQHEIAVYMPFHERETSFAAKLRLMKHVHCPDTSSAISTLGELLMFVQPNRLANLDNTSYFEIIANPSVIEKYADLYSQIAPNWIFRVWSIDVSHITNRRNVVCKNLYDLDIFQNE